MERWRNPAGATLTVSEVTGTGRAWYSRARTAWKRHCTSVGFVPKIYTPSNLETTLNRPKLKGFYKVLDPYSSKTVKVAKDKGGRREAVADGRRPRTQGRVPDGVLEHKTDVGRKRRNPVTPEG